MPPETLDGPRTTSQLQVARAVPVTLCNPPRGFRAKGVDELVEHEFALEIVQLLSAKLLPETPLREAQRQSGLSRVYVDPRARGEVSTTTPGFVTRSL